ncbi:MAG: GNAT family N-acetyltransferase [Betaproteobacteria bacterium]
MTRVDPSAGFEIRPATRADVPAIHELIAALAEYERLSDLCVATESDLDRALFGSPARAEVLVGTKAGATVAFALYFHNYSTFLGRPGLWLEDLFVRPDYRRQGCAQALLRALAGIAKARGCGRFEWSVLDWNAPAIAFYRSLGASILPDWRIARVVGPALDSMADGTPPG